jgi:succinate dehydrogenase / fumarate reductase membrane anchor subunit
MVASVTNFGRSGVYDWLMQRVSAVVLGLYVLFMIGFFVMTPHVTYENWHNLFACTSMKVFSLLAILSLGAHAWIGLWTVSTDYMKNGIARFVFQAACGLVMFIYVVWGIQILWGQ